MDESPRRRVLRTGATLFAGGLTVGLGGCQAALDDSGTATTDAETDDGTNESDRPDYAEWLPAPGALGVETYTFLSVDWTTVRSHPQLEQATATGSSLTDIDGLSPDDIATIVSVAGVFVVVGSIDADALGSVLVENGPNDPGTYGEFSMYDTLAGNPAAVSGNALVVSNHGVDDPQSAVEAVVDAKRGRVDRYVDTNPDFQTLVSALRDGVHVGGTTYEGGQPENGILTVDGVVASGARWTVDGDSATATMPAVFESESMVDTADVERWITDQFGGRGLDTVTVEQESRVAVVTATGDPSMIFNSGGSRSETPQVSFSWEYERRDDGVGVLTVQHNSGDTIRASELSFRGDGFVEADGIPDTDASELDVVRDDTHWPAANASGEIGGGPAVVSGDEVRLGVASDYEISLVWEPEDGDTAATLSEDGGPSP